MRFKQQYQQQPYKMSDDERQCTLQYVEYYYLTETHDRTLPHRIYKGRALPMSPLHSQNYAFTTKKKLANKYSYNLTKQEEHKIKMTVANWSYEKCSKFYHKLIK